MSLSRQLARLAAACTIAIAFAAAPARAEDVTLRYSNWIPAGYVFYKDIMAPWIQDVERVTEGRVRIEVSPKVIGTVAGQYDVVADGLADIAFVNPGYTPGRFTLIDGLEGPFLGDDPEQRCPAEWHAYEKFIAPLDSLKEVKVLGIYCANAQHIAMTNKEIKTLEDFKGLKIRTPVPNVTQSLERLGAVPVLKPASEVYELVSGGIIDGAVFPYDSVVGFKLAGVLKTVNVIPGGISSSVVIIAMNKAAWEKLSDADKQAIEGVSGEALAIRAGKALKIAQDEAIAALEKAGTAFVTPSEETLAAIRKAIDPVTQDWIAKAKEAGLEDPAAMLEFVAGYKPAN